MSNCEHPIVEAHRYGEGVVGLQCRSCGVRVDKRGHKYRAQRTRGYASKHEADISARLHALARSGNISNLKEQVRFTLMPAEHGERALSYIADFTYLDENGKMHVLDAKGFKTKEYRIKRRLMRYFHGIVIEEV